MRGWRRYSVTDRGVALPTTAAGWGEAIEEAAQDLRLEDDSSLAPILGPEAAAALDEFMAADAVDSIGIIGGTVSRGEAQPAAAIGAMLCTHMRLGIEYGIWLSSRKGVRA
jgi:hypothetical protein